VAALIAKLPRTKAAANVAANRVDKVRMMAPGEGDWRMRCSVSALTLPSIDTGGWQLVAERQQHMLTRKTKTPARESWRFR
jgi:hypothetical protein